MPDLTGADLRQYRERLGLSQSQLARALGVHVQTLSKWERDRQGIRHGAALRLVLERLAAETEGETRAAVHAQLRRDAKSTAAPDDDRYSYLIGRSVLRRLGIA